MLDDGSIVTRHVLNLQRIAGRSERQWKAVLSWMLGVAGTRRYLHSDGYRWIAPVSAFDPSNIEPVDVDDWDLSYPKSSLSIDRIAKRRFRPDYVALRGTSQEDLDWALVEAKGTKRSLSRISTCPASWASQVRNAAVTFSGVPILVPRHIVVATRVNPNGRSEWARRVQVRAWNERRNQQISLPSAAGMDIVGAHLFGLLSNLRLRNTARAISAVTRMKQSPGLWDNTERQKRVIAQALAELDERLSDIGSERTRTVVIETFRGSVRATISQPLLALVRGLLSANRDDFILLLRDADMALDKWEATHRDLNPTRVALPYGVEISVPEAWYHPEMLF